MSSLTFTIQKENACGPGNIWKVFYPIYFPEKMLVRDSIIFELVDFIYQCLNELSELKWFAMPVRLLEIVNFWQKLIFPID